MVKKIKDMCIFFNYIRDHGAIGDVEVSYLKILESPKTADDRMWADMLMWAGDTLGYRVRCRTEINVPKGPKQVECNYRLPWVLRKMLSRSEEDMLLRSRLWYSIPPSIENLDVMYGTESGMPERRTLREVCC